MSALRSPFLNLRETAALLGINYTTAWELVRTGRIRAFQIGRRWKVPTTAVDAFVEESTQAVQRRALARQQVRQPAGETSW